MADAPPNRAARRRQAKSVTRQRKARAKRPKGIIRAERMGPDGLDFIGPLVRASWALPPPLVALFQRTGRPIPPPFEGVMLVDTGATKTCIDNTIALTLGLQSIRKERVRGAGGEHDANVFIAELILPFERKSGEDQIRIHRPTTAVYGLSAAVVRTPDGAKLPIIGLLGRDFLRKSTMVYDGMAGEVTITVDLEEMGIT